MDFKLIATDSSQAVLQPIFSFIWQINMQLLLASKYLFLEVSMNPEDWVKYLLTEMK